MQCFGVNQAKEFEDLQSAALGFALFNKPRAC